MHAMVVIEEEQLKDDMGMDRLYICVDDQWYVLDTQTKQFYKHDAMNTQVTPFSCGCATIASKIYLIGGIYPHQSSSSSSYSSSSPAAKPKPSKTMKIFDTLSNTWDVKDHPEMNNERAGCIVIPAMKSTNLFVFGGTTSSPWGERYDLVQQIWNPLSDPPVKFMMKRGQLLGHALRCCSEQILIWDRELFGLYHVEKDCWTFVHLFWNNVPRFPKSGVSTRVAVVGQFLVWSYGADLYGYDLTKTEPTMHPMWTSEPPRSELLPIDDCDELASDLPFLVSMNQNQLCLIWYDTSKKIYCWEMSLLQKSATFAPLRAFHEQAGEFSTDGRRISCCLAQRKNLEKVSYVHWHCEDEPYQDPTAYLKTFSRTMYMNNYFSYSGNIENRNDITADPFRKSLSQEAEISVDSLVLSLGLEPQWALLLEKIIDKNALNCLNEDDYEALNIPMVVRYWLLPEQAATNPIADSSTKNSVATLPAQRI